MFYIRKTFVKLLQTYPGQQKTGLQFYSLYCEAFAILFSVYIFDASNVLGIKGIPITFSVYLMLNYVFQADYSTSGPWKWIKRGVITSCWLILCLEVDQLRSIDLRVLIQR